ncbi:predicted protein [Naegleria gruberi]|uniref:Predicted protein n=1 Tax=Naegleria gruberi TaxID=5762 RepID=D2V7R3_NAEGR|nr:uncharacterized protein NAEGRDRAFT_31869 [Naegleria gruberi]EFC47045.1 predicted protein [Naegleria gruberi]|eukprot:XP_002679789.1 predicted protein [Naegleria gruberi strain NEG-M]
MRTEPIKIPDRKSRSKKTQSNTKKIHSKKPNHLSVDPNSLDENRKLKMKNSKSFWIDCQQSSADDIHTLQKYFGIHSLTSEDMINNDSGEKWEVFDNYMFMIFTGQIADKVASNDYLPCHLNVLIFENCIITIRAESTPRRNDSADVVRKRKSTTIPSPSWVFYAYLDAIIDVYIPKVDSLTRECDTLDEFTVSLNTTEKEDLLWRIALNKRRTIVLRKLLLPKQKMITYLVSSRVPLPFIDKEIQLYLRDVLDHLTYCCDRLDIARDSLHQSHTNYLTRVQIEIAQNAQKTDAFMNRLTVFASIFGPLSVLSGIWGMNVKVPGQDIDSLYWFFGICAFMVILSLTLVMLLRKQLVSM